MDGLNIMFLFCLLGLEFEVVVGQNCVPTTVCQEVCVPTTSETTTSTTSTTTATTSTTTTAPPPPPVAASAPSPVPSPNLAPAPAPAPAPGPTTTTTGATPVSSPTEEPLDSELFDEILHGFLLFVGTLTALVILIALGALLVFAIRRWLYPERNAINPATKTEKDSKNLPDWEEEPIPDKVSVSSVSLKQPTPLPDEGAIPGSVPDIGSEEQYISKRRVPPMPDNYMANQMRGQRSMGNDVPSPADYHFYRY